MTFFGWLSGQETMWIVIGGMLGAAIAVLMFAALKYLTNSSGNQEVPKGSSSEQLAKWKRWGETDRLRQELAKIRTVNANVRIRYCDPDHFFFAERVANSFELAGWGTNFQKGAQGETGPRHEGITILGFIRSLVEDVECALQQCGLTDTNIQVGICEIGKDSPKYATAREKIYLTIGFEP